MRMPTQLHQPLRTLALSILPWLLASEAHAQLSGSAGILSNYMYRGVSLSDGRAAARLALNYDGASGWYAGGQVVTGQLAIESHRSAQWIGYAGYAHRMESGLSWETGVTAYAFPSNSSWSFREFFVGLSGETVSARLHYAPNYLGFGERTLYGEVNGGWSLAPRLQMFWHGGYLYSHDSSEISRPEARIGLATSHRGWQAQVSLDVARLRSGVSTDIYGVTTREREWHHEVVLSVARAF
ncbi:TorF family putative porin [Pseudoduganella sp. RAF53_2]|uniref:TorF family putative porin n=1 Tax=unclassified Pseudoduganella TaxID=2637179 RepID=UPI003F9E720D